MCCEMRAKFTDVQRLRRRNLVTFGVASLIVASCLSGLGLNKQGSKRERVNRKTNTERAVQVTASRSLIKLPPAPPFLPHNCEPTEKVVRLYANDTASLKSGINFTWQVPVGRLIGNSREVTWDLSGVQEGTYTATVEASDKHKHTVSGSVVVTVVTCPSWLPDPPPCPTLSVSCPSSVDSKGLVTFEATVSGVFSEIATYEWSLSAGRIISGQATRKITVDVSGVSNESVTATVSLGGLNPLCAAVASCSTHTQ